MRPAVLRWTAAILATAVTGALAGCGSGSGGDQPQSTSPPGITSSPRTATSTTTDAVAPTTTTVHATTTTTTATTTTAADLPGTGRPTVLLGDMNTPEQFVIGQLYYDALSEQGYSVDVNRNIGPTTVSEAAMTQGSLDIFPEYLNVYDAQVAGDDTRFSTLAEALVAGQTWANAHGQTLLTPTPFSDTAGIVVLSSYARAHGLHSMADLHKVDGQLTFGSPLEFSAEPDGLDTLEHAYGFTPAVTSVITIGDQYRSLSAGEVQAAYDQTTDWQLTDPTYTDLGDSDHVLGFGNVVPVVSTSVLDAEGTDFTDTINEVDALLTTRAIRGLTAEMEDATQPATAAAEVAKEFLQGYNILPLPAWSTVTATTTAPTASDSVPAVSTTTIPTGSSPGTARRRADSAP